MKEKRAYRKPLIQKISALVLGVFSIVMMIQWATLNHYGSDGKNLVIYWIFGLLLGYILIRSRFGFAGPIRRLVNNGDATMARSMILLLTLSTVVGGALIAGLGSNLNGNVNIGVGVIVGGLIFGVGMILGGGCATGILTNGGNGTVGAFIVIIFFSLGAVLGGIISVYLAKIDFIKDDVTNYSKMSKEFGWLIGIVINLVLFSGLLGIFKIIEIRWRKKVDFFTTTCAVDVEKKEDKNKLSLWYDKIFIKSWGWRIGACLLAIWFAAYVGATGATFGVTRGFQYWGGWIMWIFGYHDLARIGLLIDSQTVLDAKIIAAGPLRHTGAMFTLAILLGATFYFFSSGDFKIKFCKGWAEWLILPISGLLSGIGAKIAGGCNLGAMWFGIATFKLQGWFFATFMVLGAWSTLKIQNHIKKKQN